MSFSLSLVSKIESSNMKDFINHCLTDVDYKKEIQRKIFHILTISILPIAYIFFSKKQMLYVILPLSTIIVAADYYRHKIDFIGKIFHFVFGHILRDKEFEENTWTGASFVAVSALITFVICPKIIAICAFGILAVSDCLAALIGKGIPSKEFFEKSIAGSIAFGSSAVIILIICGLFTSQGLAYYFFGIFAVCVTTIIEARPSFFNLDDNLTIPLSFSIVMLFFDIVWDLNF